MLLINQNHPTAKSLAKTQQGFSLVELLVGLAIGLLATLVIMQVFSAFEGQKRTSTGTADAQTNGSVALYSLQRDVQLAGFGLPLYDTANMPLICIDSSGGAGVDNEARGVASVDNDADGGTPNVDLLPIRIEDGNGATDRVIVRYGDSASGGAPAKVTAVAGTNIGVTTSIGCKDQDVVYFVRSGVCHATRVDGAPAVNNVKVLDATNAVVSATTSESSDLACLGDWRQVTFEVNAANELVRQEISTRAAAQGLSNVPAVLVTGVVNIQAQYGISAKPDGNQIVQWVNATGQWAGTPGTTNAVCSAAAANRNCIKAVRVAVVARNELLEKENVSTACSSTTATAVPLTGVCAWDAKSADPSGVGWEAPAVDLSNNADWQRYRYRVYETIIPLRNIVWTGTRL